MSEPVKLKSAPVWESKIVGGVQHVNPKELVANPLNFRLHPSAQQKAFKGSVEDLGWIDIIIVNKNSGRIIDGHLRVESAIQNAQETVPILYVDLTPEQEEQALLSLDPIAAMAEEDTKRMNELADKVKQNTSNELVLEFLANLKTDEETLSENYSREIKAPGYEVTGEKPAVGDLFDNSRTLRLIEEIDKSDIPEDEKTFLRIAAQRHTVINFARVAEYYAHSSPDVKKLMEDSALVVIDFKRAIELGYVELTEVIREMYIEDYGE